MATSTTARAFLDTNVLVYAYDAGEPVKRDQALDLLASLDPTTVVISSQVLSEFYVTATRKFASSLPEGEAADAVRSLAALPSVPVTADTVLRAVAVRERWQLSYWDALIVAAAESAGCTRILTEDLASGATIAGMTIENPFD